MPTPGPAEIIERLSGIDREAPPFAPGRAEVALEEHLTRLGLAAVPVRWLADAEEGFLAARRGRTSSRWLLLDRAARTSADMAASEAESPAGLVARSVAWSPAESVAQSVAAEEAHARAGRRERRRKWTQAEFGARSAGLSAARVAAWMAASFDPLTDRSVSVWLPFLDAAEAGLWIYWVLEDEVLAVPRPALRIEGERLHSGDGPAVLWRSGTSYWFWHGVRVPRYVIEEPDRIRVSSIRKERNLEIRRVLLERYGHERYLRDVGAERVHADDYGTLWRAEVPGDEPLVMVEVLDATPQPDGTFRNYLLRVPPTMRTAREAVAWTFGKAADDYSLEAET